MVVLDVAVAIDEAGEDDAARHKRRVGVVESQNGRLVRHGANARMREFERWLKEPLIGVEFNGPPDPSGALPDDADYTAPDPWGVTVLTQPSGLECVVSNPTGTMGNANVTDVDVNCAPPAPDDNIFKDGFELAGGGA